MSYTLRLSATDSVRDRLTPSDFLWRPPGEPSSLFADVGPRGEELGDVPALHADFLRLAVLAYLVDRTVPRGRGRRGVAWTRDLPLKVPVSDPSAWTPHGEALERALDFLTGDAWHLEFVPCRLPALRTTLDTADEPDGPVLLFSGGADSLAGAVLHQARTGVEPVLLSQWNWTAIRGVQRDLVGRLHALWGDEPTHVPVHIGRREKQPWSGVRFRSEDTSRARSLLFMACGLAASGAREKPLVVAENGFTSLNLPLGGERRGPLSTRTTHPAFLDTLKQVLRSVGLVVDLQTPHEGQTKGEMFAAVGDVIGPDAASELLSASHSCSKPGAQYLGRPFGPGDQCGLCYACLVRRAAFIAADLDDRTAYTLDRLHGRPERARWLEEADRRTAWRSVEAAVDRGVQRADVVALGLPARVANRDAMALLQRGLTELAALQLDVA